PGQPASGQPGAKQGEGDGPPATGGTGQKPGQTDPNATQAGAVGTGAPNARERPAGDGGPDGPPEDGPGSKPSAAHASRAGELQLEDFKKVNKELLDDLKMSEADWAAFQKAYEERLKQKAADPAAGKGDRQRGGAAGGSAANSAAKRV